MLTGAAPGPPPATTWRRVSAWRARRHFLTGRPAHDAATVVHRLVGIQAQVPAAAERAVAVRGPAPADVRAGLADRRLLRTWAVRGTLHLLTADDAPDLLAVVGAARSWEKGTWQREFATAAEIAGLAELVAELLPGRSLTRDELVAELAPRVGSHLRDRLASGWGTLLKPLAWQGLLVNGEPSAGRPTFTSPATWCHGWPGLPDPDAAAHRVIADYLGAHGPATPEAFDAWLLRGATRRATLRRWFAELVEAGTLTVVAVRDGGAGGGAGPEERHARTVDLDELCDDTPVPDDDVVRLLPAFDQWVLGPGTTDPRVVPPEHRARVSRPGGWISPVVLRGGRVVGTWDETVDDGAVELFPGSPPLPDGAVGAELARRHASGRAGTPPPA